MSSAEDVKTVTDEVKSLADEDSDLRFGTEDAAPPQEEVDGVIILRIKTEEGNIATDVGPLGSVEADQVQTLIELGLKSWRSKIGL